MGAGSAVERAELASPVVSALSSMTSAFNPVGKISSSEMSDMGFLHSINMTIYWAQHIYVPIHSVLTLTVQFAWPSL